MRPAYSSSGEYAELRHRFGGKGSADLATSSHPFHFIKTCTYVGRFNGIPRIATALGRCT
ncbi:hypothetical protein K443DRAFT_397303 [Laccaria amethystina LaAM-08-1]|uniref:Uncharacterized protein n=1 Tax=Laccaria amethystina LaAM-08-1 TaxID=1095629 RepID=A0A0C9WXB2_9AGAR|nr:hypothetical protein K443DRAFT_397303 [Laccaria amethystina LaAM-08-1]